VERANWSLSRTRRYRDVMRASGSQCSSAIGIGAYKTMAAFSRKAA